MTGSLVSVTNLTKKIQFFITANNIKTYDSVLCNLPSSSMPWAWALNTRFRFNILYMNPLLLFSHFDTPYESACQNRINLHKHAHIQYLGQFNF